MHDSVFTVGFSGNRPSSAPGRSAAELEAMRPRIERVLRAWPQRMALANTRLELVVSAAEGADTLAGEVAISEGLPIRVILPKPIEAFRDDFANSSLNAWERARDVIEHARSGRDGSILHVIPPPYNAPNCYQNANAAILEASDGLIILWNGTPTDKRGGAGEMLELARARMLPLALLNSLEPDQVIWENVDADNASS